MIRDASIKSDLVLVNNDINLSSSMFDIIIYMEKDLLVDCQWASLLSIYIQIDWWWCVFFVKKT